MWEQLVPCVFWEPRVNTIDDGDEVTLERLDGALSWVSAVIAWRYDLIIKSFLLDCLDQCFGGFVVRAV